MKGTLAIAGREFRSYFYSPLAYVVICVGLFLLGIFFFLFRGGFWQIDRASFDRMFQYGALGLSLFIIPVITMRLLAEEKRSGTLEMLITLPVKDTEVILGKYLGALGLVLVLLLGTALYPIFMFGWPWNLGPLDPGPVLAGYLGLILFSAAAIAIGLMVSAFTESQTVAFFITFVALLILHNLSTIGEFAPGAIGEFLRVLSFDTNLQKFARGLIDTRNVIYFLSITGLCLVMAFRTLESRKWS
ncbi:MAG TPA: ABC transporter permease [Polyangiaceae bacterium]|jgi:ABC-2 type transport system permease protein|nr:MAG: ABC-2 family transporter protein [Deltaproteobacteria bacterium ADurb.Bin207]HNS97440.1 ABC transporter permease [Polyangiaceae bacterium]HNZ21647.1 ABC transporter permease [Polyangiaceae bacterium]HOD24204.1 ABC transporter permease [Polyangiaceae bacterium]HOE48604.1 ABC transporter permease [Polyangiaceae bacterium]